jgi:hypothetical protein
LAGAAAAHQRHFTWGIRNGQLIGGFGRELYLLLTLIFITVGSKMPIATAPLMQSPQTFLVHLRQSHGGQMAARRVAWA